MPEIEFEKPDGCLAEGVIYSDKSVQESQAVKRFSLRYGVVCNQILPPIEISGKDHNELLQASQKDLARLIVPYCATCPNNPKNETA